MDLSNHLESAVAISQRTLDALWEDISKGKLTLEEIREKHEDRYEMASEAIEKATQLPDVEIIVVQDNDGNVTELYSKDVVMDYSIFRDGYSFNKYGSHQTKTFTDYEDQLSELEAADIINELEE
jgi:hypothetical protein